MTRWYRAYEGTVTDAKLGEVALVAGCSRAVAIASWHCILESAASANCAGGFDVTPRRVAVILGEQPALIEAVFSELAALGMINDGKVTAWSKRQYQSDSSTERSKKSRERAKTVAQYECNGDATLQQQHATPPETDSETDTDSETEKGKGTPSQARGEKPEIVARVTEPDGCEEALAAWNDLAKETGLPKAQVLTETRRKSMRRRLAECGGLDGWSFALSKIRASPFLLGGNDRGWQADLDFVLQAKSFTKLMEGGYDASTGRPTSRRLGNIESLLAD